MSLSFLDDALGVAAGAAGIAGLLGGGQAKMHGWQERGLKEQALQSTQAGARNAGIATMLQNEADPRFQAAVADESQNIRSDFQSGIRELMVADQRQRARGLSGLLSEDRRDEGIASSTATAFEQARQEARNRVRQYLISAANVNGMLLGGIPQQPMGGGVNNTMLGLAGAFDLARAAIGGGQQPLNGGGAPGTGGSNNFYFGGQGQGMGLPQTYGKRY
jgi:hypothetical protein